LNRHIQYKNDWLYEFKPYLIVATGAFGLALKVGMNITGTYGSLAFVSGLTLLSSGYYILKLRKEFRKKSFMSK